MNNWVDVILLTLTSLLLVPVIVFCIECTVAMLPRRSHGVARSAERPRIAVLIPAHNEQACISETLRSVMPQLRSGDRIVVVADNCTDATADLAAGTGCEIVRRFDLVRRGKGYALNAGVRHIESSGNVPEVLVVFDADCIAQGGVITALARRAHETGRPVQGSYLMSLPCPPTPQGAVSALAVLVKNFVRPRGLQRLGLPCLLTGTGMAFPWEVIRSAPLASGNIVEDMQLGIDLALIGHPPIFCEEARVLGRLPSGAAAQSQRRRWEHGHLLTLFRQAPVLLWTALRTGRWTLLALLLELCVPPLSLLMLMSASASIGAIIAVPLLGAHLLPSILLGGGLAWVGLCVIGAWLRFGRKAMPVAAVLAAPRYALAKIPLYAKFIRSRQKEWVRTERQATPSSDLPIRASTGATARPPVRLFREKAG